jgi:alpha-galactosidase
MEFERAQLQLSPWPASGSGLSFKIGPSSVNALRVIAPGETIKTPAVHLGHVKGDFDATVQAMHDHPRRFVLPARKPERSYLMEYSTPGDQGYYTGRAFNEANLIKSIDVAAELGMELFMVDGGWWDVYGEFVPSPGRFPNGLEPVAEHAHNKGLLFGLYTEVEGARGNWSESKLAREHPDWLGPQDIMRLDKPEVASYVESELIRVIDRYGLDLYRHDFIPAPSPVDGTPHTREGASTLRDGFVESSYWRYYENYYAVWERIRAKYPDLILQMCSNGGWREDLDMMGRFHETYTSEGPPLVVLAPYAGKTVALPPRFLPSGSTGTATCAPRSASRRPGY